MSTLHSKKCVKQSLVNKQKYVYKKRRDEDPDQLIFGPPDSDPLLFSLDPVPTCNNGFIKSLSS